jgi:MFS family permease
MSAEPGCQPSRLEAVHVTASGTLFSFAMGFSAVAIPLFALESGFGAGEVGVMVALSACAQLGTRAVMRRLMRRFPDKHFVSASGMLMAASCLILLASAGWWAFALSQLAQGAARGFVWTATQTHAVRTSRSSVAALARVNLSSGLGQIVGPFLAGPVIEHLSVEWALAIGAVPALLVVVPASLLVRLEPLRPERGATSTLAVWRRPGLALASSAGATAGAWRAMMNSFVPIVLAEAGHGASAIGAVAAVANTTNIAGGAAAGRIRIERLTLFLAAGTLVTGLGLAGFGALADHAVTATVLLAVSGAGAGLLQTAGPALASETVRPEERGEALATAGTYRAAALLAAPLAVSGLVSLIAAPVALVALGTVMAAPVLLTRRRTR